MMKTKPIIVILLCIATMHPTLLFAQSGNGIHPWLEDDFIISLGAYLPSKDFTIRVDGETAGSELDFDRDLAVKKDEATAALSFRWKFGEKWSVTGQYYATDDSGEAVLEEDVVWGDSVLQAGSNVGAGTKLDLVRVFLGREFFTTADHHEFGMGAGLHWLQIETFIEGEFFVNDQSNGLKRESVSADLPLPNIGAWYWYSLSDRWLLSSRVDWFSASIGDYSGSLWDAGVGVNFQAWDHVGFGLTYQLFRIDVDVDKSSWRGNVELSQHGPFLSASVNW